MTRPTQVDNQIFLHHSRSELQQYRQTGNLSWLAKSQESMLHYLMNQMDDISQSKNLSVAIPGTAPSPSPWPGASHDSILALLMGSISDCFNSADISIPTLDYRWIDSENLLIMFGPRTLAGVNVDGGPGKTAGPGIPTDA